MQIFVPEKSHLAIIQHKYGCLMHVLKNEDGSCMSVKEYVKSIINKYHPNIIIHNFIIEFTNEIVMDVTINFNKMYDRVYICGFV